MRTGQPRPLRLLFTFGTSDLVTERFPHLAHGFLREFLYDPASKKLGRHCRIWERLFGERANKRQVSTKAKAGR